MKILFIADPLETFHPQKDTTYVLIAEALRRKAQAFFCSCADLCFREGKIVVQSRQITKWGAQATDITKLEADLGVAKSSAIADFDFVFMRKDPPFDETYLTATYLLSLAAEETRIINHPNALRDCNEKLFTLSFKEFCPETLVSALPVEIDRFVESVGGKAVLKPLYRRGGERVVIVDLKDPNYRTIVELSTREGVETVIAQRYLPEVVKGDKRVLLIDGEPLGAVLRVSQGKDFRNNMHLGGKAEKTKLTAREKSICDALGPEARRRGLFIVGLDMIGDYLTEINVTSPTGFQEVNTLDGLSGERSLQAQTFERLLARAKST